MPGLRQPAAMSADIVQRRHRAVVGPRPRPSGRLTGRSAASGGAMAGLVFVNGPIWGPGGGRPEALAVRDGRIVAVGDRTDALDTLSDMRFDVVDLGGPVRP